MAALLPLHRLLDLTRDWFTALPDSVQAAVLSRAKERTFAKGQRLHTRGDVSDGIYCVVRGCVRLSGVSEAENRMILDLYGPGT